MKKRKFSHENKGGSPVCTTIKNRYVILFLKEKKVRGNTMMTKTQKMLSNRHVAGIVLMATGWGWICGNFVQPVTYVWGSAADIFHCLPFVALLLLSLRFFSSFTNPLQAERSSRGARLGISIVAVLSIIACIVFIILGVINPDPNSVGVHNFEDTMPVIVLNLGTLLWLSTLIPVRLGHAETRTMSRV